MGKICVVGLWVDEMDEAISYYEKLGFPVASRKYYPNYVELEHEDRGRLMFLLAKRFDPASNTLLNFQTDDLEATMRRFREQGIVALTSERERFPEGYNVKYRDPAGNMIEFVQFDEV